MLSYCVLSDRPTGLQFSSGYRCVQAICVQSVRLVRLIRTSFPLQTTSVLGTPTTIHGSGGKSKAGNLHEDTDGLRPSSRGNGVRSNLSVASRCGGLLPSASADVRSSADVVAFEGHLCCRTMSLL